MGKKQFYTDNERLRGEYDQVCAREFALLINNIGRYFGNVTVKCPYFLPYPATFHQGLFGPVPERTMELFLAAGYRRNGNYLYAMHCADCTACVPIRLHPRNFKPNRNQLRALQKNKDVDISIGPVDPDREKLALCEKFLNTRYPYSGNSAEAYYSGFFLNRIVTSFEMNFMLNDKLIGSAILDIGDNWLNAVYFYFDPEESKRSLGTYNILTLIDFCNHKNIEYLYLGYYIKELSAMNYKVNFKPHYLYIDSRWQRGG